MLFSRCHLPEPNLKNLNYKRGLQRVYAALAVTWIVIVTFMVSSDRWIWMPWRITPTTWEETAKQFGAADVPPSFIPDKPSDTITVPALTKSGWIAALSLPMPVTGYILLFMVVPWTVRGFNKDG